MTGTGAAPTMRYLSIIIRLFSTYVSPSGRYRHVLIGPFYMWTSSTTPRDFGLIFSLPSAAIKFEFPSGVTLHRGRQSMYSGKR